MAYPSGMATRIVTLGRVHDFQGSPYSSPSKKGTITAMRSVVWDATKETLLAEPVQVPFVGGTFAIPLPVTDQDGFSDGKGNRVSGWTYILQFPQFGPQVPELADVIFTVPEGEGSLVLMPDVSELLSAGVIDLTPTILQQALEAARAAYEHQQAAQAAELSAVLQAQIAADRASAAQAAELAAVAAAANTRGRVAILTPDPKGVKAFRVTYINAFDADEAPDAGSGTVTWSQVLNVPGLLVAIGNGDFDPVEDDDPRLADARTPLAHGHVIGAIEGLQAILDSVVTDDDLGELRDQLGLKADLESPALTGIPLVPDPDGTVLGQAVNVGWVLANQGGEGGGPPPKATSTLPGVILLPGGSPGALGGTWDAPYIVGFDGLATIVYVQELTSGLATLDQLDQKQDIITGGKATQYVRGDMQLATLNKAAVGLSSVDDTNDLSKPVSVKQQTAIDAARKLVEGGAGPQLSGINWTGNVTIPAAWWGQSVTITLTGNVTSVTVQPPTDDTQSRSMLLEIRQGATPRTVADWRSVEFTNGGTEPVLSKTANAKDRVSITRMNGAQFGTLLGLNYA